MILKKTLAFLIATLITGSVFAQKLYKFYLTPQGERTTEAVLAVSYAVVQQLPEDSAWYVRQYDMHNVILTSGYYKDEQLHIPHGKFLYYQKTAVNSNENGMGTQVADTINSVQYAGYFINGKKNGVWLELFPNAKKAEQSNYKNDLLDGLYQNYDKTTGNVVNEGYYVNDKKEGDWCLLEADSTAQFTDVYKHGKIIKHLVWSTPVKYTGPESNFDFHTFIKRKTANYTFKNITGRFIIRFVVTAEGKIKDAVVIQHFEPEFDDLMLDAFLNSRGWKPATKNGVPVDETLHYTINIVNSEVYFAEPGRIHKEFNVQTGRYQ